MLDIQEISSILQAKYRGPNSGLEINDILTDSRKAYRIKQSLFVAIEGKNHDGHQFIKQLYNKGVRAFLIEKELEEYQEDAHYLRVESSMSALQFLAAYQRQQIAYPLLAITGSNGKTIVKEWLHQLLSDQLQLQRSPRSYNSQLGVPLSLWSFRKEADLGIVECGISQPGEMKKLEELVQPEYGMITNIGQAHAANFTSIEQKLDEKLKLFEQSKAIFCCADHQLVFSRLNALYPNKNILSWSRHKKTFIQLKEVEKYAEKAHIKIVHEGSELRFNIPFSDEASIENFMHCLCFAAYLELDLKKLAQKGQNLTEVSMRSQTLRGSNNTIIINDSYSSDLHSLSNAIELLANQTAFSKKTVILSDLDDSELEDSKLYTEIASMLAQKGIDHLYGIGDAISSNSSVFKVENKAFFPSTQVFLEELNTGRFKNEAILIKGARRFNLEKVAKLLQEKTHSAELEIRLHSLKHNLEVYRGMLNTNTRVMAMVKAFGYGTGDYEVAKKLEESGVDYLAVAFTDEAVLLRKRGLSLPILVLNPEKGSYEALIKHQLEPEIYSLELLQDFHASLSRSHMAELLPFPVHLNIDTGMHRLGIDLEQIDEVLDFFKQQSELKIASVFTHLSSADDPEAKAFSLKQIDNFKKAANSIEEAIGYKGIKHVLNTAGVENYLDFQFDLVRLGIGLYGVSSKPEISKRLEAVTVFKARVLQVKKVRKDEPIGYSRAETASRDMSIATVSVGYADGLRRSLSRGKGELFINGNPCPIVGNVCMDMCMVDVSNLRIKAGDEVEIFGNNTSVMEFAKKMDTIPYEVLTSVSGRVRRSYVDE